MYFCVNEFEVGVKDRIFSGNDSKRCIALVSTGSKVFLRDVNNETFSLKSLNMPLY